MPLAATAGAVGVGLVTRLVGSGVQRLGSLAFQKIIRIAKIENALKGSVAKSTAVQVAINDFETLVGTRYGQLNRQLFDFLREIERSGIVNTMVENALINRNSSELERIFCDLHVKVVGPDGGIGFSSVPLPRHQFKVEQLGGISLQAWRQIIHHEGRSSEVAAGYLFAMMMATELQGRTEDEGPRSARRKSKPIRRGEVIEWALTNAGIEKLKTFPQIKAAVEAKSLFI